MKWYDMTSRNLTYSAVLIVTWMAILYFAFTSLVFAVTPFWGVVTAIILVACYTQLTIQYCRITWPHTYHRLMCFAWFKLGCKDAANRHARQCLIHCVGDDNFTAYDAHVARRVTYPKETA